MKKPILVVKHHYLESDAPKRQKELQKKLSEFMKAKRGGKTDDVCHLLPPQ